MWINRKKAVLVCQVRKCLYYKTTFIFMNSFECTIESASWKSDFGKINYSNKGAIKLFEITLSYYISSH